MLETYKDLKKYFELTLKEYLENNNQIECFDNIKRNIIIPSSKEEFGDYQSNICLVMSKLFKKKPRDIALEFISILKKNPSINRLCKTFDVAGPGFINIKLKEVVYIKQLLRNAKCPRAGIPLAIKRTEEKREMKIIVDFSSPNIVRINIITI